MEPLPPRLVLFDGVCVVCDAGMTWLMDHDPTRRLAYAPLQGETAAAVLARHDVPEGLDSIVYVEQTPEGERISWHSTALLRICRELPLPWRVLALGWWVPRPLRDWAYRTFARSRYSIFGTKDSCRIPTEDEAALFWP